MEITEVRIKLMDDAGDRLQAFCSITFDDCFVVRDLKIIEGTNGPFVAMPSRKLTYHCPRCGCKNHLRAPYCNQCGDRLHDDRVVKEDDGRAKLYADIAHPINSSCREMIQHRVIRAFHEELDRAKLPDYVSRYEDFDRDAIYVSDQPTDSNSEDEPTDPGDESSPSASYSPPPPHTARSKPRSTKPTQNMGVNPPHKTSSHRQGDSGPRRSHDGGFGEGVFE